MYASDYPHGESWFPKSVETVPGWDLPETPQAQAVLGQRRQVLRPLSLGRHGAGLAPRRAGSQGAPPGCLVNCRPAVPMDMARGAP